MCILFNCMEKTFTFKRIQREREKKVSVFFSLINNNGTKTVPNNFYNKDQHMNKIKQFTSSNLVFIHPFSRFALDIQSLHLPCQLLLGRKCFRISETVIDSIYIGIERGKRYFSNFADVQFPID